jgi:hypothetical protein
LREERGLRVFDNRVLSRIFVHKKDEVRGKWRKLHNEYDHDLYSSPNIVWAIKSEMTWAVYVARMVECRGVYRVWLGNLRERDHLEDPDVDGSIILR